MCAERWPLLATATWCPRRSSASAWGRCARLPAYSLPPSLCPSSLRTSTSSTCTTQAASSNSVANSHALHSATPFSVRNSGPSTAALTYIFVCLCAIASIRKYFDSDVKLTSCESAYSYSCRADDARVETVMRFSFSYRTIIWEYLRTHDKALQTESLVW